MSGIKTMDFEHLKEEDLADGSLLNSLIHEFLKDCSKETALYISIYEAMDMVNHADGSLDGLVINAFSEPFLIPKDMFSMIEK